MPKSSQNAKNKVDSNGDDAVNDKHDGSEDQVAKEGNIENKAIEKKSQPVITTDVMHGQKLEQPSNEKLTAPATTKVEDTDVDDLEAKLKTLRVSYEDLFRAIRDLHSEQNFNDADYKLFCELLDENSNFKSHINKHVRDNKAIEPYELNLEDICLPGTTFQVTTENYSTLFSTAVFNTAAIYAWELPITNAFVTNLCKELEKNDGVKDYRYWLHLQFQDTLREYEDLHEFHFLYIGKNDGKRCKVGTRLKEEYNGIFNNKPSKSQNALSYFLEDLSQNRGYPARACLISKKGTLPMERMVGMVLNIKPGIDFKKKANAINRKGLGVK
ncbi:unnamed protein product [Rotaria socialis]|uniref:Uncharacterized protein n=1 Tax=Rotaria socialis TaxID=392032 RepID=A0A820VEW3_9BILA|nr:unnamed protein product [Rotaria socialis]CAF4499033.1 unnamed protein product [Rotaria socialis]